MADENRLFDVKAAAAYLGGISPLTVHAWLSEGRLRRVKVGSRTMVRRSELDRLISAGDGGKSPGRPRLERQR
ncbi:MAG TPA: helix-turn-helix domain-containing protein [Terriglobales bacterium]|jgi:excisionase family DNA binding protein